MSPGQREAAARLRKVADGIEAGGVLGIAYTVCNDDRTVTQFHGWYGPTDAQPSPYLRLVEAVMFLIYAMGKRAFAEKEQPLQ